MKLDRVKQSLKRREGHVRDASLFVVATEGEKTEEIYLNSFQSSRIKVIAVICDDGKSSPDGVLARLSSVMKAFQFGDGDSFWMLIDRDRWTEAMLSAVHSEAKKKGISILCSNQRFEVFLCAHFEEFETSQHIKEGRYEEFLKERLNHFNKTNYDCTDIRKNAAAACDRCERLDISQTELWPPEHSSRAYKLVRSLLSRIGD